LAEQTLRGSVFERGTATTVNFVGIRLPIFTGYQLQGELITPDKEGVAWMGEIPNEVIEDEWEFYSPSHEEERKTIRLGLRGQASQFGVDDLAVAQTDREIENEEIRYSGLLRGMATPLNFDVATDPEPLTIVVLGVIAAGCLIDWKFRGGRERCVEQYASLSSECIQAGGSPEIRVHSVLGLSVKPGISFGCHLKCDFVCHQP
jgi:hypothetical protein